MELCFALWGGRVFGEGGGRRPLGREARPPCAGWARPSVTMVEGHQVHRVAALHRRCLVGVRFGASSPNGRFREGAKRLDGRVLRRVEAHGKNLFYFFHDAAYPSANNTEAVPLEDNVVADVEKGGAVVMHVHFGMSGRFQLHPSPGPPPTPNTRLALRSAGGPRLVAHLSAMTCDHGGRGLYDARRKELGPDPLREDADPDALWARLQATKRPVGAVLMDQSAVAGVGNIYRAEILFRAGVHPETSVCKLSRSDFERVWVECVRLLQRGYSSGSILTVDEGDPMLAADAATARRYIYNRNTCARCAQPVKSWKMAARTVYVCEQCQPLSAAVKADVSEERLRVVRNASVHTQFLSHCAPEAGSKRRTGGRGGGAANSTVAQLRVKLRRCGLPAGGNKAELLQRLQGALLPSAEDDFDKLRPGTMHLGAIRSEFDAAMEKIRAGESTAVEHVGQVNFAEREAEAAKSEDEPRSEARQRPRRAPQKAARSGRRQLRSRETLEDGAVDADVQLEKEMLATERVEANGDAGAPKKDDEATPRRSTRRSTRKRTL